MIDPIWLLLLLPAAAASGWYAARLDQASRSPGPRPALPQAYIEGLNFLLNEQPDKAIEVFIKALEVDPETVETHLAIGNLFRRRGEIERATRIHQNLIARPNLGKVQRFHALFELAQDYHKAGLLDRAENLFQELAEGSQFAEPALRNLLDIYQQEKEWAKAIATARRLGRVAGKRMDELIAQYHCEQAEEAESLGDIETALQLANKALATDRACVRASILLGDIAHSRDDCPGAIRHWRLIESQDALYLGEVVSRISDCYRNLGDEQGLYEFLHEALERHGGLTFMLALADVIAQRDGNRVAQTFVTEWLRDHPSAGGLQRLIELRLSEADSDGRRDLDILRGIIGGLLEQHSGYGCRRCGFKAKSLHWQCPSCKRWTTIKPVIDEEGEAAGA